MKILRSFSRIAAVAMILGISGLGAINKKNDSTQQQGFQDQAKAVFNAIVDTPSKQAAVAVAGTLLGCVLAKEGAAFVLEHQVALMPLATGALYAGAALYADKGGNSVGAAVATGSHFVFNARWYKRMDEKTMKNLSIFNHGIFKNQVIFGLCSAGLGYASAYVPGAINSIVKNINSVVNKISTKNNDASTPKVSESKIG